MRRAAVALAALLVLGAADGARAARTDVMVLTNGDRVTCEIKYLQHSKLTVKTDDMGTLAVKWERIARLSSRNWFLVRTVSGFLHYGTLAESGADGVLTVAGPTREVDLRMADVGAIERIKTDWWSKIDIAVSFGYSYTKSTAVTALNSEGSIRYTGRVHRLGLELLADVNETNEDVKRRYDATAIYTRIVSGRLGAFGLAGLRRHDELGLKARVQGGGGLGYLFADSRTSEIGLTAGANLTREWSRDGNLGENSWEAVLGGRVKFFTYETPKTDITLRAQAMPNMTIGRRLRYEIDIKARREFVTDLFVALKWYESGDNEPPEGASAKSDRGVVFGIEWTK